jgi:hypothetical protein
VHLAKCVFREAGTHPISCADETTKDITVSQTMLRHAKPDSTAIYTHGNFDKAVDAQRMYLDQLLKMKPATESTQ